MELKDFVARVLVDIVEGIREAQTTVGHEDADVSPYLRGGVNVSGWKGLRDRLDRSLHEVEFDVAVTATEGTGTRGGVGVVMGVVALGSRGESSRTSESVSRVKFSVPVRLPAPSEAEAMRRDDAAKKCSQTAASETRDLSG